MNNNKLSHLIKQPKQVDKEEYQKTLSQMIDRIANQCPEQWEFILLDIAARAQMPMLENLSDSDIIREASRREGLVALYRRYAK